MHNLDAPIRRRLRRVNSSLHDQLNTMKLPMTESIESANTRLAETAWDAPQITAVGDSGLLMTPAQGAFNSHTQSRLLAFARLLEQAPAEDRFVEVVPGMNNLLVLFNPLRCSASDAERRLRLQWADVDNEPADTREIEIPVVYGGAVGEDLAMLAAHAGLPVDAYILRHSQAVYTVACIGAYPGFAYMSGLPPELAVPRRATPRLKLAEGAVIVGGAQAGVMPCTAPSGWHVMGSTTTPMFDVRREFPGLLLPGDRVRFTVERIDA